MERISGMDTKVRGLTDLLAHPQPVLALGAQIEPIDPATQRERERHQIREAARQEGLATGMAEAEQKLGAAIDEARQQLQQAHAAESERLAAANRKMQELLKTVAQAADEAEVANVVCAVEMAYTAVIRVLDGAAAEGELIKRMCRKALEEYRQRPVVLRVPRADVELLCELATDVDICIEGDSHLTAGQCRLQTRKGDYDTSLEVRLDALKQAFLRSLEHGFEQEDTLT